MDPKSQVKDNARLDAKWQKEALAVGMRRISLSKGKSSETSSSSDATVVTYNTVERNENRKADSKMAGIAFNFAVDMQRKTLSRAELTKLTQRKFDEVAAQTKAYADAVHVKMDLLLEKETEMRRQIDQYQHETRTSMKEFIDTQVAELRQRGFEMQEKLMHRIDEAEGTVIDFKERLQENERDLKIMTARMEQEYKDFVQARKRWKSDFQTADKKNQEHIERVHAMIGGCENQNEINTRAVKMILDAQMIEQLVQRQDIEDRKHLLLMAQKNHKDLMSTDLGVHAREIFGPITDPSKLKFDRNTGGKAEARQSSFDARVPSVHQQAVEDAMHNL